MKKFLTIALLSVAAFSGYAYAEAWYELDDEETYVMDFVLEPGAVKEVTIDSTVGLAVGFRSDLVGIDEYRALQAKYNTEVIQLHNFNNDSTLSTVSGGRVDVQPVDGKLRVSLKNLSDQEFKIVVYTEPIEEW